MSSPLPSKSRRITAMLFGGFFIPKNRLMLDFGGDTLPCSDVNANALYFLITALSYNLFALIRQLLPEQLAHHRAVTVRWRLYAMAAKVVKTGRQWYVKLKENHRCLLEQALIAVREFAPPPM